MKTDQLHFFLFFVSLCVSIIILPVAHSKCIPDQQQSLLHFKSSLLFDASLSSKLVTWNSSTDCCSWAGVTCSINGSVLGLDISSESISGGIDNSSSLFHLQNLQRLNLANNYFGNDGSSIPPAFGELMNLRYLNLSSTAHSGQIPIEMARLTRLVVIDISHNYINGHYLEIPSLHMLVENLTKLEELYLDYVQISIEGSEWCQAISSSLPNLRVLSLSTCNLSGPFHDSLAKLQSLSVIHLDWNNISAPVPAFFANFSNLISLSLVYCNLQGTFPKEIFRLPSLREISLLGNENLEGSLPEFPKNGSLQDLDLSWTSFSGILPNSIGNLKMLSTIEISRCNFTGSIPKSMANLTQLVSLRMYGNKFEGSIPSFSGAKNLEYIDLSSNGLLTGNINHITWRNLSNLSSLDLSDNMLNGNIPSALFSLPLLETLDLSNNQFSGHFPEISNISRYYVKYLGLRGNNLEGPIPMSIFDIQGLESLDLSSNNFSGSILLDGLQHTIFTSVDFSNNKLTGSIPDEIGELKSFLVLDLSNNAFTGAIPSSLRKLSMLESLDLSQNTLSGQIPVQLTNLIYLHFLNLSNNHLEGKIPSSNQFTRFPKSSFEGNKGLFGPPLTEENNQPNSGDEIDWNVISVEIGFTCGLGISIGSLLLYKRWRIWYYRTMYQILVRVFPQLEQGFGRHRRHVYIGERYWRMLR